MLEYQKNHFKANFFFVLKHVLRKLLEIVSYFVVLLCQPKRSMLPVIDDHNLITPAVKLSRQIKAGHISCEEVVESFITRIKRINPIINAVVDKRFEQALKEARDVDRRISEVLDGEGDKSILDLPLLGVPLSVKETVAVDGYSYTGGVYGRRSVKAPKNSDAVELLQRAGLIPICLTNIPEMAIWWDACNQVYGRTLNPYDLSRIAGGSSGGEAALIGAAGSVVGIGSDFAGSIRIPSNFCGIFGHKPTPFIISNEGIYPSLKGEREKLFGVGPMTRYACDLKPMVKIMADRKAFKLQLDEPVDLNKIKVYYLEDLTDPLASKPDADILTGIRQAASYFEQKYNVIAKKITLEELRYGVFLWACEANVADGPKMALYFKKGKEEMEPSWELVKRFFNCSDHAFNGIFATYIENATPYYGTPKHTHLSKRATDLRNKFYNIVGDDGVLLMPTHPEAAPPHNSTPLKSFNLSYTAVASVLQCPITQCPLGMTKEGLPFGVQILSRPFNDRYTIAVAEELEKAFGGWQAPCRVTVD